MRNNDTIKHLLQVEVQDVRAFLAHVEKAGGAVKFGPSQDAEAGFWYGGFTDPEGNVIWVVDHTCP